jgi:transposase-like protein
MSTKTCPACGSQDVVTKNVTRSFYDRFAGEIETNITEDVCSLCGMEGDFESVNDFETKLALEHLKKNAAQNIINAFVANGFNLASIERALELPQRTLSKWRNDTPPAAAGLTLLKFISLFPWLLTVADTNFDILKSQEICAHNAISYIYNQRNQSCSNIVSQQQHTASINIIQNNQFVFNSSIENSEINIQARMA